MRLTYLRAASTFLAVSAVSVAGAAIKRTEDATTLPIRADPSILILGGGVAGIIAARTLYKQNITNFVIVEARGM